MDINSIISISYLVMGFILSIYWFNKDYADSYNAAIVDGNVEKGMSSMTMLGLMIFWPFVFVRNLIKKKRI